MQKMIYQILNEINMCQFIFVVAGFAFIGVIYILVLEFTGIFKINNDQINEELLDELLIKEKKNVSNNKKNKKEGK